MKFPINPFPDVKPEEFNKLNKKRVTEDFVAENFIKLGWRVYEPFNDTGIDRIIMKNVCPNGHTPTEEDGKDLCKTCGTKTMRIERYLQVKTRTLKDNIFGFTLKSKDLRTDPRHFFILYSDSTMDFFIVGILDFLSFFIKNKINPFSSTSFRKGNNKLNSLKRNTAGDWFWNNKDFNSFLNENGLKLLQNEQIDINLNKKTEQTREYLNILLNVFTCGNSYTKEFGEIINKELIAKPNKISFTRGRMETVIDKIKENNVTNNKEALIESTKKYWEGVKQSENSGEEEVF